MQVVEVHRGIVAMVVEVEELKGDLGSDNEALH